MSRLAIKPTAHIVDVLGNVVGRDQPILQIEKALEMVSLLGPEVFSDENVVFFDPFCKAGEILLACAFQSCWAKAKSGSQPLSIEAVFQEVYLSNRYFGLSPDERHHRLSMRTFLGNTHSHNEKLNHVIRDGHYLSEIDGKLDKPKFEKEFAAMIEYIKSHAQRKRLIAVGNPPYQENDGGQGGSAKAVYNLFAEALIDSKEITELLLVIPSRWFTSGKGAKNFRERVIKMKNIRNIHHFVDSKKVFPTVDIQGGVCFFHCDKSYLGEVDFVVNKQSHRIDLSGSDIILDDPRGYDIFGKVKAKWKGEYVSKIAWTVRPWAIRTFYFDRKKPLPDGHKNAIPCFSKRRTILNADVSDIPKNLDRIDEWKVAVPTGYSLGSRRVTLPPHQYFVVPKGHITTETYNIVGSFKKKQEAENFRDYLATNFARYLLGLRKVTQHIYQGQWEWVPLIDVSQEWTDELLFKHFGITKEEQKHIEKMLLEWS